MHGSGIGDGSHKLKNYIDQNKDLSSGMTGTSLALQMRFGKDSAGDQSGRGSKKSVMKESKTPAGGNNQKLSKRKKDFELAKDKILAHLDLTKPLEKGNKGKLLLNLEMARAA